MSTHAPLIRESGWFHRTAVKTVRGCYRILWGATWSGGANVPEDGPALIVSNHPSYLDPLAIYVGAPRRVYFMAWKRLFEVPWMGNFIRRNGVFPVDNQHTDVTAFRTTLRLLKEGRLVGIFPEGGRSLPDGRMMPFLDSPFRVAMRLRVPVAPVTVNGSGRVWPRNKPLPRTGGTIEVTFHHPIVPDAFPPTAGELAARARSMILSAYRERPAVIEASSRVQVLPADAHPTVQADRAGIPVAEWVKRQGM